jgi:hypothetical protein
MGTDGHCQALAELDANGGVAGSGKWDFGIIDQTMPRNGAVTRSGLDNIDEMIRHREDLNYSKTRGTAAFAALQQNAG